MEMTTFDVNPFQTKSKEKPNDRHVTAFEQQAIQKSFGGFSVDRRPNHSQVTAREKSFNSKSEICNWLRLRSSCAALRPSHSCAGQPNLTDLSPFIYPSVARALCERVRIYHTSPKWIRIEEIQVCLTFALLQPLYFQFQLNEIMQMIWPNSTSQSQQLGQIFVSVTIAATAVAAATAAGRRCCYRRSTIIRWKRAHRCTQTKQTTVGECVCVCMLTIGEP